MKNVKIRTRIIFISCVMVLTASILVMGILLWVTYRSMKKEAYAEASKNAYWEFADFSTAINKYKQSDGIELYIQYYLKTSTDGKLICVNNEDGREIYNSTVLKVSNLSMLQYSSDFDLEYIYIMNVEAGII